MNKYIFIVNFPAKLNPYSCTWNAIFKRGY